MYFAENKSEEPGQVMLRRELFPVFLSKVSLSSSRHDFVIGSAFVNLCVRKNLLTYLNKDCYEDIAQFFDEEIQ